MRPKKRRRRKRERGGGSEESEEIKGKANKKRPVVWIRKSSMY